MFQDEEDNRALSPAPCSAGGNTPSTTKEFQMSIQNDTVRLYTEIKCTEGDNLDLVLSGARPFDPPAFKAMDSDPASPMYGQEVARSGGHWIVSLEISENSVMAGRCILADPRTAAAAIVYCTHRLATAQEVGTNRLAADAVKLEAGK
jgi:hypothetical protein